MHLVVRRTLFGLSASYALLWATLSMVAGPGSAALVGLVGDLRVSGVFIALLALGAAAGARFAGGLMDRWGRRPVLILGHALGAAGHAGAGIGVHLGALVPFLVGLLVLAFGFGATNLTRMAAAELFPLAGRGRAMAAAQMSATLGAIVGPLLLILTDPIAGIIGTEPLPLVWWVAPPLHVAAMLVLARIEEPARIAANLDAYHEGGDGPLPVAVPAAPHAQGVAVMALVGSQAAMVSVMGVAGAAVTAAGAGVRVLGVLMLMHFVGMFGLSRFVGRVADRAGRRTTIGIGLGLLGIGGSVIATWTELAGFGIGLFVVGVGWSFGWIGATLLLTDITIPARRARVVGRGDLFAQLGGAVVAAGAGVWFARDGLPGLGILAVLVVVLPALALWLLRPVDPIEAVADA